MTTQGTSPWASLMETAKKEIADFETRSSKSDGPPFFFLDDGSYKVRIYPDDSGGGKRLVRKIYLHTCKVTRTDKEGKSYEARLNVNCPGEAFCHICKALEVARKQNYDPWHYNAKEKGLAKMVIFSSSITNDYIKIGTPAIVMLHYKMIYGINKIVTSATDPDQLNFIFDPTKECPVITIDHKSGSGGNTIVQPNVFEKKVLPPLPDGFPKLDDFYVAEKPSDNDIREFVTQIQKELAEHVKIADPSKLGSPVDTKAAVSIQPDKTDKPATQPTPEQAPLFTPPQTSTPAFAGCKDIKGPDKLAGGKPRPEGVPDCYGAKPDALRQECLQCAIENACIKDTIDLKLQSGAIK